ncbi:MAG: hypothetical protein QOF76_3450 [Solirubrobacteraceae bacterium]|nr:hypothetical protein [Solirubrobacteraceae bacterium]
MGMGVSMVVMTLPLPLGREIDWEAAARAIRNLKLGTIWNAQEELYPWEDWVDVDEDGDLPSARAALVGLRVAQGFLRARAAALRGAIAYEYAEELMEVRTRTHHVFITGGPSPGDSPTDLFDDACFLAEAGIITAAGFDSYTSFANSSLDARELEFGPHDTRRVHVGMALAHALAEDLFPPAADPSSATLLRELGRGLSGAAHRTTRFDLARAIADLADGPALAAIPFQQSPIAAIGRLAAAPDDPDSLLLAATTLADLHGDAVGAISATPLTLISTDWPGPSELRNTPLREYLSVVDLGAPDWDAAQRAASSKELLADLAELRAFAGGEEYRRYATREWVGERKLLIAAPHDGPDVPDLALGLGRLARAGVLKAAGVAGWWTPDPDFPGPTHSYVRGYMPGAPEYYE